MKTDYKKDELLLLCEAYDVSYQKRENKTKLSEKTIKCHSNMWGTPFQNTKCCHIMAKLMILWSIWMYRLTHGLVLFAKKVIEDDFEESVLYHT